MTHTKRVVIAVLFLVVAAVNAAILSGLLATLFFAVTVVYVLEPLYLWLRRRGLSRWMAGAASTAVAGLGVLALVVPLAVVVYLRRDRILAVFDVFPDELAVEVGRFAYTVETGDLIDPARDLLTEVAIDVAAASPVLAAKAVVFAFVVFGVLIRREELRAALLDPIPDDYVGVAVGLHERARKTLLALYITQGATALGTFLIALPVFFLFGYESFVVLAVAAGLLQFIPIVGPSVVVLGMVVLEAVGGSATTAALLLVVGLVLIGFLPDAVIRPRLARRTADLPASLYFVGFTGGILSLGAVGVIAGPLAVALLAETVTLLGEKSHSAPASDLEEGESADT